MYNLKIELLFYNGDQDGKARFQTSKSTIFLLNIFRLLFISVWENLPVLFNRGRVAPLFTTTVITFII